MSKNIYVADDEQNIRDIITGFLTKEGYNTEAFSSGDELLQKFYKQPSDLVILDVMMPGTDGLAVCNTLRRTHNVPIVIVSARDSELDRITGITMGSDDYLVKPFSPMELVARVKAIFRRIELERTPTMAGILSYGNIKLNTDMRTATVGDAAFDLTPTEFELLVYMFGNSTRAVKREELLKNVWGFDNEVDTRVTDDVLKRLRKKLLNTSVKITTLWGFGFKLETD